MQGREQKHTLTFILLTTVAKSWTWESPEAVKPSTMAVVASPKPYQAAAAAPQHQQQTQQ